MTEDAQTPHGKQAQQSQGGSGTRVVKNVTIVVMGTPYKRPTYPISETLRDASLNAIKATNQGPKDLKKWELKNDDGTVLDFDKTFAGAEIPKGATLRLTRKAGTAASWRGP